MVTILGFIILFILCFVMYCSIAYSNPYKLITKFGKKGCGKTTDIVKESIKYNKRGWTVYTTEYIPNTYHFGYTDLGKFQFAKKSCILIDEVGMIFDNRNFKNFDAKIRDFFILQRHYKCRVILYSQSFNCDKKLRDLSDELYIMKSYFNCICVQKKVLKDVKVVEASADSESRIADNLRVMPFIVPGSRKFTWLPKYHKYFDSFAAPELENKRFRYIYATKNLEGLHMKVQWFYFKIILKCKLLSLKLWWIAKKIELKSKWKRGV